MRADEECLGGLVNAEVAGGGVLAVHAFVELFARQKLACQSLDAYLCTFSVKSDLF